jgi:ribose 5-phosphate isomerase RpiB
MAQGQKLGGVVAAATKVTGVRAGLCTGATAVHTMEHIHSMNTVIKELGPVE